MRVLLINPPTPTELKSPLLGQQYVAAALLAHGCDVRIVDGSACSGLPDPEDIASVAHRWHPDIIGMGLFTPCVYHSYDLSRRLSRLAPWLLAGGPHATVCPEEPLEHGFNAVLTGEVEHAIVKFVDFVGGRGNPDLIPGLIIRDSQGKIRKVRPSQPIENLDEIPLPLIAQHLYDAHWYNASDSVIPGGVIASRGCSSRCTFCANAVTGRRFRHRSVDSVIDELEILHRLHGMSFFVFWDDALNGDPRHAQALCRAFEKDLSFPMLWHASVRACNASLELLHAMKMSGCTSLNIGVESGDDAILAEIGKGITTDRIVAVVEWAKAEGIIITCNFMMGFPQESPRELEKTLRFMERIAPLVDSFSTMGVLVPYPGTAVYDRYHLQYGFTHWWLKKEYSQFPAQHKIDGLEYYDREYLEDPNLDLDFFHYTAEQRALIRECLRFKATHNMAMMGLHRTDTKHAMKPS